MKKKNFYYQQHLKETQLSMNQENPEKYVFHQNKESSIKDPISQLQLNENTKSIYYDINQRKLYANYKSNMVIYDSITGHPLFSLKTHQNELSKIQYLDKQDIMITSSKDKEIKFWGFSEESVNNIYRTKNNYILVQNKDKDISTFDQQTNYNDDNQYNTNDDNDDLNSWTRDNQEQSVQKKDSQEPIQKDIQNAADDDDLHGWNM